jgi:hypothetical protein
MSRRADTKPLSFEQLVSPEVAANYRRLRRDKRTAKVKAKFLKRGMTDLQFGYFLQMISTLPLHWKSQNEAWKKSLPKLIRIAQTLRGLATEISADPDLARFLIDLEVTVPSYNGPSRHREIGMFLERAAAQIESANQHLVDRRKAAHASPAWRPFLPSFVSSATTHDPSRGPFPNGRVGYAARWACVSQTWHRQWACPRGKCSAWRWGEVRN